MLQNYTGTEAQCHAVVTRTLQAQGPRTGAGSLPSQGEKAHRDPGVRELRGPSLPPAPDWPSRVREVRNCFDRRRNVYLGYHLTGNCWLAAFVDFAIRHCAQ